MSSMVPADRQLFESRNCAAAEAEAYGIDLSLLEENLRLSPEERIRAHCRALQTALELRAAMERKRAGS